MVTEIHHITEDSELYPPLLREIAEPPAQLYVRGQVELLAHTPLCAVVGSRRASAYGRHVVRTVIQPVAAAGIPLVSGLAYGIDSAVHLACLEVNTPTIAVLGGGVDDQSLYPRRHISLAHQIIACGGTLVSEYPPGTPALPHHFIARNRIIAGLCQATIIVQAAERSGSLTTARLALDANRDVMAIPGAITDSLAVGTNRLIQQGASVVVSSNDLLAYFNIAPAVQIHPTIKLSPIQQTIVEQVSTSPLHIDELIVHTQLSAATISAEITQLELLGVLENVGGMRYVRSQST